MSLSNPSQLLLRNIDLLNAKNPLLINPPADQLSKEIKQHYHDAELSCFTFNYADYLFLTNLNNAQCYFAAEYRPSTQIKHDLAIIFFPKSKHEFSYTLTMLNKHLAENASVLIVGENNSGVKSVLKLTTNFLNNNGKVDSARHCTLFSGQFNNEVQPFELSQWYKNYSLNINNIELTISSLPGVFSQNELDVGTKLLLNNLPHKMHSEVLDFGCGAGVISAYIGKKYSNIKLNLLDINALALKSAEKTLAINGLQGNIFASDSLSNVSGKYQHIVANPPFHQGVKTHYAATESFLTGIKQHIKNSGDITIVANNFLRYQNIMEDNIGKTTKITNKNGFAIYRCQF
jgi:16S rRNA (guanine1207-N2)-methyltransferase